MSNNEILVIDDELQIQKLLQITLESHGYSVKQTLTGKEGLVAAAASSFQLIILDLGLPDEDGRKVLKKLREWYKNPIIILSIQNNEDDIISSLDNGANDYLVKPFRTGELLARIRSVLRGVAREENNPVLKHGKLEFDFSAHTVKKNNELIRLTATQYALLTLFAKNEGKVLTHQYILREIWGNDYIDQSQYLRVFIAQLRRKIEDDANHPEYIITESGIGYRFVAKEV
ncbi:response regulator [Ferruginibacter albus]|uniref:response regulator n=1 Tax=Ferruginibacter albus TaxID=2875540 RepID=UPI001CC736CE|nr:response regulator transcription factor [Ferruginibacter albus]UAY51463.1 response regulator transcription factor [Ferruginibacter albus]